MPKDLSLMQVGDLTRVARCRLRLWRSLRQVDGYATLPLARQASVDRAAKLLVDRCRAELLRRYRIDPKTLWPLPGSPAFQSFSQVLDPNSLPERKRAIAWHAK